MNENNSVVDWLLTKIDELGALIPSKNTDEFLKIKEEARIIFKTQIMDSYFNGKLSNIDKLKDTSEIKKLKKLKDLNLVSADTIKYFDTYFNKK